MGRRETKPKPFEVRRLVESEHRAGVDLAWIVAFTVGLCVLAIVLAVPDRVVGRIEELDLNVNGVIALLVIVPLGATLFALRRYRDAIGAQKELQRLSLHDALTGLPNRRHLREVLPSTFVHASRHNTQAAVFFVDLDGFKGVNDTYGHEVGDHLMVAVGQRLLRVAGDTRWVSRYAGDEFVLIDPAPPTNEHAARFAQELIAAIEAPFTIGEDRLSISASVGFAFGDTSDDPEAVLSDADVAMYEAKRGTDRTARYSDAMRLSMTPTTADRRLSDALERGEFTLLYQPIVALRSGRLVGAEALLRWDDPTRGVVAPRDFLEALEETGLIVPVGRWVMSEACSQAARWADHAGDGRPPLRITFNASPRQLAQVDFVDDLRAALDESGIDPGLVYLELTEAALINDPRAAWASLAQVRDLGVGLALDDFGTGYSSLNHLRSFDLELLKLDPSLLNRLGQGGKDEAIVRHIFSLARALGVATLAEGITDEQQIGLLSELGCELGQGFHYSDPQPATIIEYLLRNDMASPPEADGTAAAVVSPQSRGPQH